MTYLPKKITASLMRLTKNFIPPLTTAITSLVAIDPAFMLAVNSIHALIGYYGDYANDKTIDLIQEFIKNREAIVGEIVNSDKFKAAFIKIIGDNITESNEEKRQYLKNYILNMASGINNAFNEHTKLINTLNNITLEEIDMLRLWDENGAIETYQKSNLRYNSMTVGDIENIIRVSNQIQNSKLFGWGRERNNSKANQILLSLGYKDLLYVLSKDNFGSGEEAKVKEITDFGKVFLSFIKR